MDLHLEGKRAFVTGSSRGIGAAIACRLGSEGASVVVHGRNAGRAEGIARQIRREGGRAAVVLGDLTTDELASGVISQALGAFGVLDIVVNNAGMSGVSDWTSTPAVRWTEMFGNNVVSMVRVIRGTLPAMKKNGWGRYIQIAGSPGAVPLGEAPDFVATKGAIAHLTMSLGHVLAGSGVTVNTVSPGPIRTPGLEAYFVDFAKGMGLAGDSFDDVAQPVMDSAFGHLATKRLGRDEEVADAVAFLASPRADSINGANLRVDGGLVGAAH